MVSPVGDDIRFEKNMGLALPLVDLVEGLRQRLGSVGPLVSCPDQNEPPDSACDPLTELGGTPRLTTQIDDPGGGGRPEGYQSR